MTNEIKGLPNGLYFQLFLDAFRGNRREKLEAFCQSPLLKLEISAGVIMHDFPRDRDLGGFSRDVVKRAQEGVETIRATIPGKRAGLAYGLDGRTDGDSSRLTVEEKGTRMGRAAAASRADLCLPNAETQWDTTTGPDDDMNDAGALEMGRFYRTYAPNTITIDQPWPMPDQHGENRKTPKPIGQGGSFAGFPIDEFATWVQGRAPQVYWANWYRTWGKDAYSKVLQWHKKEWETIERGMRALDPALIKPRISTIQGYGHDAFPWTAVDYIVRKANREAVIVWCDPAPTAGFLEVVVAAQRVLDFGRRVGISDGVEAIKAFQRSVNLPDDGIIGPKTLAKIDPRMV